MHNRHSSCCNQQYFHSTANTWLKSGERKKKGEMATVVTEKPHPHPPLSPISYVSSSPDPSCSEKKSWCCVTLQVKRCLQCDPELSAHSFAVPAGQLAPPLWIRNCHCSNVHCSVLCWTVHASAYRFLPFPFPNARFVYCRLLFYVSCNAVKAAQQSEYLGISVKHLVTENQSYILKQSSVTVDTFFVDFARLTLHCQ